MKRYFAYLSVAMLALGSCTNEIHEEGIVDKSNAISFNTYTPKSRAVNGDVTSDNMKGDHFGVAGYTSDNKIYLYKGTASGVEQKWDAGNWGYADMADLKFWPNSAMNFYAYFPYSDNATFAPNYDSGNVMTIPSVNCSHDVLFASALNQSKTGRVPLTFYHAFSKIKGVQIEMPSNGTVYKSKCQLQVKEVTFINTATNGNIIVNTSGEASYSAPTKSLVQSTTVVGAINRDNATTATPYDLINNGSNASGYLFATNGTVQNNVIGTNKALWNGEKTSLGGGTLSGSELVCLKLTCKVWNGADTNKYYYVGGDGDENYGVIYIPLTGAKVTSSNPSGADATAFLAGKRYTYKIVMNDNVGFDDNGDPILNPILFTASVDNWSDVDVTVTITL